MASPFVWFDLVSADTEASRDFYAELFEWEISDSDGPVPMRLVGGDEPWASIAEGKADGWVPYVKVDDVDAAAARARELGATVLREKTRGPAGWFTVIADPNGASLALWEAAAA